MSAVMPDANAADEFSAYPGFVRKVRLQLLRQEQSSDEFERFQERCSVDQVRHAYATSKAKRRTERRQVIA